MTDHELIDGLDPTMAGEIAGKPATPAVTEEAVDAILDKDKVKWVVNDNAELGVKIGNKFFWCYKGSSLVYRDGTHDDGSPMHWRPVFKREFGECIHPINYDDLTKIGTVSLDDSNEWCPLPAALSGEHVPGVEVKPLEWVRGKVNYRYKGAIYNGIEAKTLTGGRYVIDHIEHDPDAPPRGGVKHSTFAPYYSAQCSSWSMRCGKFETIDDAKAACQADYKRRICSALQQAGGVHE